MSLWSVGTLRFLWKAAKKWNLCFAVSIQVFSGAQIPLEAQQIMKALKCPGLTSERSRALGALGAEGPHQSCCTGSLWGRGKPSQASRRRERADLGWPLLREERDWQVWDKQQLQTAPCSLLGGKVPRPSLTPTPLIILPHHVSVRPSEKNRRLGVFRVDFFIFFRGVFLLSASPMWNLPRCPHSSWAAFLHCLPFSWWWEPGSQLGCLSKP